VEARQQLHQRLAERGHIRVQRQAVERLTVHELLDLYEADCGDHGRVIQTGRLEPWRHVLGAVRAVDVQRDHVDAICRQWRKRGLTWEAGEYQRSDGTVVRWAARDPKRVRPVSGASCNRLVAVLRRAYRLGQEKRGLLTPLTFPHYEEGERGEYLTEDQCVAICTHFQAKDGAAAKADVFRLAYLLGIRKGQLRATLKKHVLITGDTWKLRWPAKATKGGKKTKRAHEVILVDEAREIVQRAWNARRPDCEHLFHVNGKPLGPMLSELKRTCELLGIVYGRGEGIVFHDTRHSAVTNLVGSGAGEAVAMTITGHADPSVFKRYNVRRDDVQADALTRQQSYLAKKRDTTPTVPTITRKA
jgi:integrase